MGQRTRAELKLNKALEYACVVPFFNQDGGDMFGFGREVEIKVKMCIISRVSEVSFLISGINGSARVVEMSMMIRCRGRFRIRLR